MIIKLISLLILLIISTIVSSDSVGYNTFTFYGDNCGDWGSNLTLSNCENICNSGSVSISPNVFKTDSFDINFFNQGDDSCSNSVQQINFVCLANEELVKVNGYAVSCKVVVIPSSYVSFQLTNDDGLCPESGAYLNVSNCQSLCGLDHVSILPRDGVTDGFYINFYNYSQDTCSDDNLVGNDVFQCSSSTSIVNDGTNEFNLHCIKATTPSPTATAAPTQPPTSAPTVAPSTYVSFEFYGDNCPEDGQFLNVGNCQNACGVDQVSIIPDTTVTDGFIINYYNITDLTCGNLLQTDKFQCSSGAKYVAYFHIYCYRTPPPQPTPTATQTTTPAPTVAPSSYISFGFYGDNCPEDGDYLVVGDCQNACGVEHVSIVPDTTVNDGFIINYYNISDNTCGLLQETDKFQCSSGAKYVAYFHIYCYRTAPPQPTPTATQTTTPTPTLPPSAYNQFEFYGDNCPEDGVTLSVGNCQNACNFELVSIIPSTSVTDGFSILYYNISDASCSNQIDSDVFRCSGGESVVDNFDIYCQKSTQAPSKYNQFEFYGDGCPSDGEFLDVGNCQNACGVKRVSIIPSTTVADGFTIQYFDMIDTYCHDVTDTNQFQCSASAHYVDYFHIYCDAVNPTSTPTETQTTTPSPTPTFTPSEYQGFDFYGGSCPSTGFNLSNSYCQDLCGDYRVSVIALSTVQDGFQFNFYNDTDTDCEDTVLSIGKFICTDSNTDNNLNGYNIYCETSYTATTPTPTSTSTPKSNNSISKLSNFNNILILLILLLISLIF